MRVQLTKLVTSIASFIVPTDKKIFLFGAWYGDRFGDNSRYFFEWLHVNNQALDCYWVTKNPQLAEQLQRQGYKVLYGAGWRSIWLHFRAQAVFCNCSPESDLYGEYLNKKTLVFNLWHGSPIKKIGFDAIDSGMASSRLGFQNRRSGIAALVPTSIKGFLKQLTEKETYYLASSEKIAKILASAMGVGRKKIIVNGYPKLDHLIKDTRQPVLGNILYAPTYRGEYNSENDLLSSFGFDVDAVAQWLEVYQLTLTIRLHPANNLPQSLIEKLSTQSRIVVGGKGDLYEEIKNYQLVITDFSSVYYDALAVNIKAVIAPFGLEEYINEDRQLYYTPQQLFPYPMANDWPKLLELIPSYLSQSLDLTEVRNEFYQDKSGQSCQSLWPLIKERISKSV